MASEDDWTELTVDSPDGSRLDAYLAARLPLSRSRIVQLIDAGMVLLNGEPPRKRVVPAAGDRIRIRIPPPEPSALTPERIPIDILYQDSDLLVIDKPAGLVVHPAPGHRGGRDGRRRRCGHYRVAEPIVLPEDPGEEKGAGADSHVGDVERGPA